MCGLLRIVTVIKFATENYKNLICKNLKIHHFWYSRHLKNTKSGHVIFLICWYVTWPMFYSQMFPSCPFYPIFLFLPISKFMKKMSVIKMGHVPFPFCSRYCPPDGASPKNKIKWFSLSVFFLFWNSKSQIGVSSVWFLFSWELHFFPFHAHVKK